MVNVPEHGHEPVMVEEVVRLLMGELGAAVESGRRRVFLDCTLGRGGHAARLAQAMAASGGGVLIGMDVDPENLKYARQRIEATGVVVAAAGAAADGGSGGAANVELRTFHANFGEAEDVLSAVGVEKVDGLLADFGVSTNQLLDAKHGLSFNAELPLDMRLDPRIKKRASDILKEWDEKQIADVLHDYAQERFAYRIARKIVQTRASEPILSTGQLARLVRSVQPPAKFGQIDPATRTFQALRMAVNSELESITDLLRVVPEIMAVGGRSVFLSFHSGEDRLVKQANREWEEKGMGRTMTKKPAEPGLDEIQRNPRSRSAKLRGFTFEPGVHG